MVNRNIEFVSLIFLGLLFSFCIGERGGSGKSRNHTTQDDNSHINRSIENPDSPAKGEWDFGARELWRVETAGDSPLVWPGSVCVDDEDNVYLLDAKYNKIFSFAPDGEFRYSFGEKGEGPGEFMNPTDLFLMNNILIVRESGNRIQHFTQKGEFLQTFKAGSYCRPRMFLSEYTFVTIRTDPERRRGEEFLEIFDLRNRERRVLWAIVPEIPVSSSHGKGSDRIRIQIHDESLSIQVVIALGGNGGEICFGRNDRYRVNKIGIDGRGILSFSIRGRKQKGVPVEYKEKLIDPIVIKGKKLSGDAKKKMMSNMADVSNYFNQIHADDNGGIYVFVTDVSERGGREIDIFSPEGKYLYRGKIELPGKLSIRGKMVFKGETLYVLADDENGIRCLIKYSITAPDVESHRI